jgi:hypothetical protein
MATNDQVNRRSFIRGIGVGVIASLVGMMMMDVVIIVEFLIMGQPALTYLDLIGSIFGGGIPLGIVVHVLLGSLLGIAFSIPVLTIEALRIDTMRKGIVIGVLVGVVSIVACVPMAILIQERIITVLILMTIPHLAWGLGLGEVAGYGLRTESAAKGS